MKLVSFWSRWVRRASESNCLTKLAQACSKAASNSVLKSHQIQRQAFSDLCAFYNLLQSKIRSLYTCSKFDSWKETTIICINYSISNTTICDYTNWQFFTWESTTRT